VYTEQRKKTISLAKQKDKFQLEVEKIWPCPEFHVTREPLKLTMIGYNIIAEMNHQNRSQRRSIASTKDFKQERNESCTSQQVTNTATKIPSLLISGATPQKESTELRNDQESREPQLEEHRRGLRRPRLEIPQELNTTQRANTTSPEIKKNLHCQQ